jgi:hypothetical protein
VVSCLLALFDRRGGLLVLGVLRLLCGKADLVADADRALDLLVGVAI